MASLFYWHTAVLYTARMKKILVSKVLKMVTATFVNGSARARCCSLQLLHEGGQGFPFFL